MATEIKFDLGLKTYTIGGVDITLNPTDPAVLKRIYKAFEGLDAVQREYDAKLPEAKKDELLWLELAETTDKEMRTRIDEAFGAPVADAIFGDVNCYALSDGLPVWMVLMLAVIDQLEKDITAQKKLTNPRLEKYVKKYATER